MNPIETLRDRGASAPQVCVIGTGAGAGVAARLWSPPGVSNMLIGAHFPYAMGETAHYLGYTPPRYCTLDVALGLAMAAYMRAYRPGHESIGVGLTASVASLEAHKRPHNIYVAAFTDTACYYAHAEIPKGLGFDQRVIDGQIADQMAINILLFAAGLPTEPMPHGIAFVPIECMANARALVLERPYFSATGKRPAKPTLKLLYPGSFHPLHDGHVNGGQAASETMAAVHGQYAEVVYATTVDPVHKPQLSVPTMLQKANSMWGHHFLLTERDALYIDKAERYPRSAIVMGADALLSMLDPRWGVPPEKVLSSFEHHQNKILVLGRLIGEKFTTLDDILDRVPADKRYLFTPVPGRWDVSSTALRAAAEAAAAGLHK